VSVTNKNRLTLGEIAAKVKMGTVFLARRFVEAMLRSVKCNYIGRSLVSYLHITCSFCVVQVAKIIMVPGRIAAAAQIVQSYSPVGAMVHGYIVPWAHPPESPPQSIYRSVQQFCLAHSRDNQTRMDRHIAHRNLFEKQLCWLVRSSTNCPRVMRSAS